MYRVTTNGNYNLVLSNIMLAQQRQMDAGDKLATQKNGSDLKDYSRNAEMLTAILPLWRGMPQMRSTSS